MIGGRRKKGRKEREKRKMLSPDGYLNSSRLIPQCNNCRSFKGHNILTDFPPLLVPGAQHAPFTSCHEAGPAWVSPRRPQVAHVQEKEGGVHNLDAL